MLISLGYFGNYISTLFSYRESLGSNNLIHILRQCQRSIQFFVFLNISSQEIGDDLCLNPCQFLASSNSSCAEVCTAANLFSGSADKRWYSDAMMLRGADQIQSDCNTKLNFDSSCLPGADARPNATSSPAIGTRAAVFQESRGYANRSASRETGSGSTLEFLAQHIAAFEFRHHRCRASSAA